MFVNHSSEEVLVVREQPSYGEIRTIVSKTKHFLDFSSN